MMRRKHNADALFSKRYLSFSIVFYVIFIWRSHSSGWPKSEIWVPVLRWSWN